jgi:two-component system KDP operon response regulator KdpE
MKILVADDDARVLEAVVISLRLQWDDAVLVKAHDGEAGLRLFLEEDPDVVLLDVNMPKRSGFEVLTEIRKVSDVPVLLLSARGEDSDQVHGLELGADDYLVKPFSHGVLVARIRAVLRRADMPPPVNFLPDFAAGDLAIRFQDQLVTVGGEVVKLTPVEYKLLYHLVRNVGHLLPHQALLDRVWGSGYTATPEYLKVFVSRLRAKLGGPNGPRYIETERGRGYRFTRLRGLQASSREPEPTRMDGMQEDARQRA